VCSREEFEICIRVMGESEGKIGNYDVGEELRHRVTADKLFPENVVLFEILEFVDHEIL
jgi:hypothetical protein